MPSVLDPNAEGTAAVRNTDLASVNHGYEYPDGLDLRPGREFHDRLVDRVLLRASESYRETNHRHDDMRNMDRVLKAYIYQPETRGRDASRPDGGYVGERIIMPVSYVVLETLLTYMNNAFMRSPVFAYEGVGPEDILGAKLLEMVVDRHVHRNAVGLSLHTAWRDAFAYGTGYASPEWHIERGRKVVKEPVGMLNRTLNLLLQTGTERRIADYEVLFEGNRLNNIDPYRVLPDPNVAAHELQKGEFFGWSDQDSLNSLYAQESLDEELFNVKYLRQIQGDLASIYTRTSTRDGDKTEKKISSNRPVGLVWMYVDLIPKEWKLGKGDKPEKWVFLVAADRVLLRCSPIGLAHNQFPVACACPDYDGYSVTPTSRLFAIEEMQRLVDFLYTSHVENIKRTVNNNFVVDPSLVNMADVDDNRPGKVIRLRKRAWGRGGIRDNAIFQLDVRDVTQGNMQEAMFLMEQAKQATSTMDSLGGVMQPRTSRVSASEAQGLRSSGLSRLERPAQLISMQFMQPIARMFASNVQQLMNQELYVKTLGDTEQILREDYGQPVQSGRLKVTPLDLVVDYDVSAHDGAVPGKENAQVWTELYQIIGGNPELAQQFDMVRIFKHIARELGAKDVDNFARRRPEVVSDEQMQQALDAGDAIPMGEVA